MGNGFHASSCMTLRDCMPPAILLHHCNTAARYSRGFQTACMARFNTQQPSSCFQTFGHSVSRGSAACCCSAPLLLGYLHKQEHQPLFTAAAAAAGTCALDASEPPSLHCCGRRPSFTVPLHYCCRHPGPGCLRAPPGIVLHLDTRHLRTRGTLCPTDASRMRP